MPDNRDFALAGIWRDCKEFVFGRQNDRIGSAKTQSKSGK